MRYLHSTPPFAALPHARDLRDRPPPAPLLAAAVHAQSEGLLITGHRWGKNGTKIHFANESLCAMSGYTTAELRRHGLALLHRNDKNFPALSAWHHSLRHGHIHTGEGELTRKNGTRLHATWSFSPIADQDGTVSHIVATYRDRTEERRLEDELIHSQRLDAVGRLAGGVAHDFNNLLSVISGYCEIIAAKGTVRRQAGHELEEIHLASQKAAALVQQLLAVSRRQAMRPKVINLNQLVQSDADILARLLKPRKKLSLTLDPAGLHFRVDPAQLQQVILNLVLNARDALADGGTVSIRTSLHEAPPSEIPGQARKLTPGRYVVLTVADNGSGMDAHTQAHLFEPFFTTKESGKGTGLGLALVYGVVQQSGGQIFVDSAPGLGTTFNLYFPEVTETPQAPARSLPKLPQAKGRENILVVEEDEKLRTLIQRALRKDGYHITVKRNASEALGSLKPKSRPVDLLILQSCSDYPQASHDLALHLHAHSPALRIIATGNPDCVPPPELALLPFVCLPKPLALSGILRAVRKLLDQTLSAS